MDTDPISIEATGEDSPNLDWIIPFDRDLVIMSDPGAGQYVITGNQRLVPGNASMVKTTAFEMRGGAKPVETGRTILFPFKSGRFSGIKEFFTNDEVATNGVETTTETVDKYIVGLIDHMICSTNFSMGVFKTDDADYTNTVWVYKYLWQNTEKVQSAWAKWEFPFPVEYFYFEDSELYVLLRVDEDDATNTYVVSALDLDIPIDDVADYHICLDLKQTLTVTENVEDETLVDVTLPYAGVEFVQSTDCLAPGRPVSADTVVDNEDGTYTYQLFADAAPDGAEVVAGIPYERLIQPTMPFVRDRDGSVRPRSTVTVTSFLIEYEDTGYLKGSVTSRFRNDPIETIMDWIALDNDPIDPTGRGLRSGIMVVPVGERSDRCQITLTSSDVRPTTLLEVEYTGQVHRGSRG